MGKRNGNRGKKWNISQCIPFFGNHPDYITALMGHSVLWVTKKYQSLGEVPVEVTLVILNG